MARVPKTETDMQSLASARGGTFLGPWVNTQVKTGWRCAHGHEWQTTPNKIQQGSWCPYCAQRVPKTETDMQALAAAKNGTFLGPLVNTITKTGWRCTEGHEWLALPTSIQRGSWCPVCAGNVKKTAADMHSLAATKGGTFLGPFVNTQTKARWRCQQGHEWQAQPSNVKQGHWCPVCAGKARKTEADMQALAAAKNGFFVGPFKTVDDKAGWRCHRGHEWRATPNDIQQGKWCIVCAGNVKKTEADMQALAAAKGGTFLGPLVNINVKARWRCSKGHEWKAKPTHVRRGSWCPRCCNNGPSKGQLQVLEFVRQVLPGQEVRSCDRSVLRNPKTGRQLELDIWIPGLKIAIEYNGDYHHSLRSPRGREALAKDALKARLCSQQDIRLLTVWDAQWSQDVLAVKTGLQEALSP